MLSSLYSGASGMKSMSTGVSSISNNLANISTTAYKASSVLFADLMSAYATTSASSSVQTSQLGLGAGVSTVRTIFTQGGLETGNSATDLAISGNGYFAVFNNGETEYTRAGNFRFTAEGALVDPGGWTLMGRRISGGTEASRATPIVLDLSEGGDGAMAGKATSLITAASQLGGLGDSSSDAANPYFSMVSSWNGTISPPLGSSSYSYSEAIQFHDAAGKLQSGTIYYDLAGQNGGQTVLEYVVAIDPSEDGSSLAGSEAAGLLMAGSMTFSSSGQLTNVTAFTPPASGQPGDLAGWLPAETADGSPVFNVTLAGGASQSIKLNMGLNLNGGASAGLASAAEAASNPSAIYSAAEASRNAQSALFSGSSPGLLHSSYDGYAAGELADLRVSSDGIVSGVYSNGQTRELYRVTLYAFTSESGLESVGNNHYKATDAAGAIVEGVAGEEQFGSIQSNYLESSNVDYATEFTNLIITQRGFQMNSKVVTTSDEILKKALELKR